MTKFEQAQELYGRGAFSDAIDVMSRMSGAERASQDVLLLLAVSQARLKRDREAIESFSELLGLFPQCFEAMTWMAILKKNRRDIREAIHYAQKAIELRPNDAAGHSVLGGCYLYLRQPDLAIDAFLVAVNLAPDLAEHEHNLGLAYQMAHRNGEAISHLKNAIALAPRNVQSYLSLSGIYSMYGMYGKSIECLSSGLAMIPRSAALHSAAAAGFTMIRNDSAAEFHHRRALELSPDSKGAYAAWLLNQGRFTESNAIYEAMLEQEPLQGMAFYGIMQSRKLTNDDGLLLEEMTALASTASQMAGAQMHLRFGLGKAQEQRKNYQEAMAHYDEANRLAYEIHNAAYPFDIEKFRDEHVRVRQRYESLATLGLVGSQSPKPIFIIGMIRSGTTLLDQILSSHPSVSSAGELRFWIEEALRLTASDGLPSASDLQALADEYVQYLELLAGDSQRITDKMPLNFAYAGIIHAAMPNARFLHIRRHPVDTCLSIYTTYFGQGTLFGYRKENIVAYYQEYQRIMAYWREVLPKDRLLELDYEELISNPETIIPKLIEFCGLPWDEACLHHDQNESAINTPSRWQARQPMYKTSLERWRNYEPWLGEFARLLPPSPTSYENIGVLE